MGHSLSVTSNTFQFRDDSESKSAINKTFCGHRLHWFKKIKSDLLPYVPKLRLFWGRFGSRYVEAAYDTNDMMLIFFKLSGDILRKVNRLIYAFKIN
jgi:hypothetical protein